MKISVTAHPKSSKEKVVEKDSVHFEVWVREAPDKGKANDAILELLSEYLDIPKSRIKLLRGLAGKHKVFEIKGAEA